MRIKLLLSILISLLFLVGCESEYQRGYKAGLESAPAEAMKEARQEGYQRGYNEGFEKSYPGSPLVRKEPFASIFKLLAWVGLLKVLLTIFFVNLQVVFSGGPWQVIAGKAIYSALGIGSAILLLAIIPNSESALDLVLMENPDSSLANFLICAFSATFGYVFFKYTVKFIVKDHKPVLLGWCAFILSGILTVLVPIGFFMREKVPDISLYSSSLILASMLVGAIYFVADSLLRQKEEINILANILVEDTEKDHVQ